jgi:hypothetical protein
MSGGRAPHRAARRSPARAATGLYFGRATDTAGADLWCEFRHEARITADGDGACVARTRRRSATCRRGSVQHRARHTYTSSARVRLRSVRTDAPMHAPSAVRTAGAVLSARNNSVSARGARGRGRGARTRGGGGALRGHGAPTPAPHADHRDFFRAGSPARGAPLRRCAAPSAAWRAHRAPERERRTVGPRAAQTPGSERGARRLRARDCGGGCGQNAAGLGTSRG